MGNEVQQSKDTAAHRPTGMIELGWFHRYPARFPSRTVARILKTAKDRLGEDLKVVLDPFAGTGATLAAARQLELSAIGLELSHLGVLIAKVRLVPPDDPTAIACRVKEWVEAYQGPSARGCTDQLGMWLGNANAKQLPYFLRRLRAIRDLRTRDFLTLALSSALRPASVWLPGSIKPQIDPERIPPSLGSTFVRSARALARDCLLEKVIGTPKSATIMKGDARTIPLAGGAIDCIATSPPYFATYDYFDVQRLSYMAFGWPLEGHLQIGKGARIDVDGIGFVAPRALRPWYESDFRRERTIDGRALRAYTSAMRDHFSEAFRVVRPGGVVAYAVGNSYRSGRKFDLRKAVGELLREAGFEELSYRRRKRSTKLILPAGRNRRTGKFSSRAKETVTEWVVYGVRPRKKSAR